MKGLRLSILLLSLILTACQSFGDKGTIASLRHVQIDIKEEKIDGGLDKAMRGYQRFLEETPQSDLTPEAIRRLADLKIEKEYGTLTEEIEAADTSTAAVPSALEQKKTSFTHSPGTYRTSENESSPELTAGHRLNACAFK